MPGGLGESQLSSLLESVPGLASVLRSPVADAIVNMIRAGVGLRDFDVQEARELVQYATRRGLIPQSEGASLLEEVEAVAPGKRGRKGAAQGRSKVKRPSPKKPAKVANKKKSKTKAVRAAAKRKTTGKANPKKATTKAKPAARAAKKKAANSKKRRR